MELIAINLLFGALAVWVAASIGTEAARSWGSSLLLLLWMAFACVLSAPFTLATFALLAAAFAVPVGWSIRKRLQMNVRIVLVIYACFAIPGIRSVYLQHQLRHQFPIASMSERLSHESTIVADPQSAFMTAYQDDRLFSAKVSQGIVDLDFELQRDGSDREYHLRSLHLHESEAFAWAAGFGVGRMAQPFGVREFEIAPPRIEPLPELPADEIESFIPLEGGTIRTAESQELAATELNMSQTVVEELAQRTYLATNASRFVPRDTLGYIAGKQQAAGFQSHRFASVPELINSDQLGRRWEIVRLELVSLLKFKEPRVYVSKDLPQMEKLQSVPTRSLDEFETRALTKLWYDEDVVIDEEPQRLRMLGSLRAVTKCLECHSVKRGQLLGAFSYELRQRR